MPHRIRIYSIRQCFSKRCRICYSRCYTKVACGNLIRSVENLVSLRLHTRVAYGYRGVEKFMPLRLHTLLSEINFIP